MSRLNLRSAPAGLPLLNLAEDVARRRARGLVVAEAPHPPATGGAVLATLPDAFVMLLDSAELARRRVSLATAFAHELAHAIDNLVGAWSAEESEREDYANALGPLLLANEPATVGEAHRLALGTVVPV